MKVSMRLSFLLAIAVLLLAAAPMTVLGQEGVVCEAYNEAPELAAMVEAGELPPIAERLPANPRVVEPAEGIGQYGGTLFDLYDGNRLAEFRKFGYENLVRWNPEGTEVIPNIAESWEINEDATEYTFFLREGMKWSDGQPFTADDIVFWWENVETDPAIYPGGPYPYFIVEGERATVTKVDDYAVKFSWSKPHGLFLQMLSTSYGVRVTQFPHHYLEQFDPDFNPDGVAQMMADAGQAEFGPWWISRVGSYGHQAEYNDPARPTLQPWMPTAPYIGQERFTFVRNPYYFKIDPACNQLPYIGERTWTLATDPEVRLLKTIDGEDYFSRPEISQPINRAVFFDNQETGNYRFINVVNSDFNTMQLHLKFNHPDAVMAEILQNKDFRIGLSHAMDRQTVIDTIFIGQGVPHQQGPRPESPFYNEQLATQYTEYNVELANQHLDAVLPERDAEGFRLRPDGERFVLSVLVNTGFRPNFVDIMQLVERSWEEVGIDTLIVTVPDDIWRNRLQEDDVDGFVWIGENGSGLLPLIATNFHAWTPEIAWGWIAWNQLRLNPDASVTAEPVEPPAPIQRQYEIMSELLQAVGIEAQSALMNELLQISADEFYTIGLSLPLGDYQVVNNTLRNVPETVIGGWLYPGPAPINFETFYIDESFAQ
jgi:peptide/nickel transport system substrate-binding protein